MNKRILPQRRVWRSMLDYTRTGSVNRDWVWDMLGMMRGVYTYEELARLKIESELRTTYIIEAKKAKTLRYYDSHAKPGDTGDEVPASRDLDILDKGK